MAKYRKISPRIWNDAGFRQLSDKGKLVFFLLLTHPRTSAIGTLRVFVQGLAPEMGWTEQAFREAFGEVLAAGMAKASEREGLIWLPNFMKYNAPESPNVLRSWAPALGDCPECALKNEVCAAVRAFARGLGPGFYKAFAEAFGEAGGQASLNQEQEQEQEQDLQTLTAFESWPADSLDGTEQDEDAEEARGPEASGEACPYREIVNLYHAALPGHRRLKVLGEARKKTIKARWNDAGKRLRDRGRAHGRQERLAWLRTFFASVAQSPFLTGQVHQRDRPPFLADLDFLFSPKGFAGVIEGKYRDRED